MNHKRTLFITITYMGKDYIWDRHIQSLMKLNMGDDIVDWLIIDNTDDDSYSQRLHNSTLLLKKKFNKIKIIGLRNTDANSRDKIGLSYKVAEGFAVSREYDFIMLHETDVIPNEDDYIKLRKVISKEKRIVSGIMKTGRRFSVTKKRTLWGKDNKVEDIYFDNGIIEKYIDESTVFEVASAGFGFLLFDGQILKNIYFRHNIRHYNHGDVFFYDDLAKKGVKIYAMGSVTPVHDKQSWIDVRR